MKFVFKTQMFLWQHYICEGHKKWLIFAQQAATQLLFLLSYDVYTALSAESRGDIFVMLIVSFLTMGTDKVEGDKDKKH